MSDADGAPDGDRPPERPDHSSAASSGADTSDYSWLTQDPTLHEPVLIVMLTGWIDTAGAAADAADVVLDECGVAPLIRFDDDAFIDYRARRPTMELRDGVNSNLVWNHVELGAGRSPAGRDVLLLTGPEPDMRWRRFATCVGDIAVELGVTQMVSFGAYPFAAPHTRPPRLSVSSPSTDVLGSVTFARSSVDVPAGVAAALEHTMHARKIPAMGIWAQVPHYVSAMSYPASSVALLEGLEAATGIAIEGSALRNEVEIQRQRIDRMVADNDEHGAMIKQLESLHDAALEDDADAAQAAAEMRLKSGDEIAEEIQEFLRGQD